MFHSVGGSLYCCDLELDATHTSPSGNDIIVVSPSSDICHSQLFKADRFIEISVQLLLAFASTLYVP